MGFKAPGVTTTSPNSLQNNKRHFITPFMDENDPKKKKFFESQAVPGIYYKSLPKLKAHTFMRTACQRRSMESSALY